MARLPSLNAPRAFGCAAGLGARSDTEVLRVHEAFGAIDVAALAREARP